MPHRVYLAVDLGAESGRLMAGIWEGSKIRLEEIHRFPNGPVILADSLRWDVLRLWMEIQHGFAIAATRFGNTIVSAGADTWGVDYVLLSKSRELLGQPFHYRDARTNSIMQHAFARVSREHIFQETGLQFMQFNTLFQLIALKKHAPELLDAADRLLFMPDFFHWAMCGATVAEFTIASTSQCLHPFHRDWARSLVKAFDLPIDIFPQVVAPGTELGTLRPELANKSGLPPIKVIAPPAHDTASAVAGVPTASTGTPNWAYISSGTWSLMGVELAHASLSARTLELNMTNEGGLDNTCRLLKNIMGLWLVQQCRRAFEARAGRVYEYAELARLAAQAPPLRSIVNPDDPRFLNPADMPQAIQEFCRQTGQPIPETEGQLVRCCYESLALKYRQVLHWLEELIGNRIEVIHIVGGGCQSALLNQFAADACKRPIVAGPVEATAMGNLLVQVRASRELSSLDQMRDVVRASSTVSTYEPGKAPEWEAAAEKFARLPSA